MLINYVQDKGNSEFYPTPDSIVKRMLSKVNWTTVTTVLEPSAGKGDILRGIAKTANSLNYVKSADAIEIDANLRSILKYNFSEENENAIRDRKNEIMKSRGGYAEQSSQTGVYRYYDNTDRQWHDFPDKEQRELASLNNALKYFLKDGIHIVHDDFLTYTDYKRYSLIAMNPPFSNGDKHLLKALEMQKNGGQIVCLLNAETIRNPYTETRSHLVKLLNEYNAEIEYIENAFTDAERKADVDVALIYVNIPYSVNDADNSIFDRMAKAKRYSEPEADEMTELEVTDFIKAIVNRYRVEIESGIELIQEYERMLPYLRPSINPKEKSVYETPLIRLTNGTDGCSRVTVNSYVADVRRKYWKALLTNEKFIGKLTSKLQAEYRVRVDSFAEYDFSEYNIYSLVTEINSQIKNGVEDEIEAMYDRLTEEHAYYPECKRNKHLYNGWKTNKAWKIDKKSILPCYGIFGSWDGKPRVYEAYSALADIERVLNFFDGNMAAEIDLESQLRHSFENGVTKNIHCKFFDVTFYKKGTVHITFTCPELIDRYNIYCAKNRRWLPPSYGTKAYNDMTSEEKAVVDEFQGEQAYSRIVNRPDYYLTPPVHKTVLLLGEQSA